MQRVKKGCHYFWIDYRDGFRIHADTDWRQECSTTRFEKGNYFLSTDEAEKVVSKLRAVLKGADVIEMPSEEDFYNEEFKTNHYFFAKDGAAVVGAHQIGFKHCYDWLKSKIVK